MVVRGAGCVDALVTAPHVEAHPVGSTLDILLLTLIYVCGETVYVLLIKTSLNKYFIAFCFFLPRQTMDNKFSETGKDSVYH